MTIASGGQQSALVPVGPAPSLSPTTRPTVSPTPSPTPSPTQEEPPPPALPAVGADLRLLAPFDLRSPHTLLEPPPVEAVAEAVPEEVARRKLKAVTGTGVGEAALAALALLTDRDYGQIQPDGTSAPFFTRHLVWAYISLEPCVSHGLMLDETFTCRTIVYADARSGDYLFATSGPLS